MEPRCEKTINLLVISVGMSPLEILTHQIDSCLEQIECGPKRLRRRLGRERGHEVTLRFSREFGKRTACRRSDAREPDAILCRVSDSRFVERTVRIKRRETDLSGPSGTHVKGASIDARAEFRPAGPRRVGAVSERQGGLSDMSGNGKSFGTRTVRIEARND
jgi:hypothetical protein